MENPRQMVAAFIQSLETHPNGPQIIAVIEEIISADDVAIDPVHFASLKELSNNNVSLLVDFWILRGSILKEEGRDEEALQFFFEAPQWNPEDVRIWLRIADYFSGHGELLKATYFLTEAQKRLDSSNSSLLTDDLVQIQHQVEHNLSLPPGYHRSSAVSPPSPFIPSESSSKATLPLSFSPDAESLWDQALECFDEGIRADKQIYLNAYVHYAHSTIRKILGLDGNFKIGLERVVAQYGLYDFKRFFLKLNHLRNATVHDNYLLSKEEAQVLHSQIVQFLNSLSKSLSDP
ncbi:MAG: hypothetical protein JSV04_02480 [Candidatus Heimdallarchaeota archaeon]|nr:MAG: hypothetical protein JSV04_02480 [Candidatus Heimdallarchaeota archaeon]